MGQTSKENTQKSKKAQDGILALSVIVPVYNTPREALDRMIDSISKQSKTKGNEYETILIDDGSKPECAVYLDSLSKNYQNTRVFHITNGGVSNARNTGLELAQGKYITFIDADDYVAEDFFDTALKIAEKYDADAVYGNIEYVPPIFSLVKQNTTEVNVVEKEKMDDLKCCLLNYPRGTLKYSVIGSPCGRIFKLETIRHIRFRTDIHFSEDQIFNREVMNICSMAVSAPYTWYYYVQNEYSATHDTVSVPNLFAESSNFFSILLEMNAKESEYVRNIARIANMNYYGAIVLNGYIYTKRPWKLTYSHMKEGMNHSLMQETILNMRFSWPYMNMLEKAKFFLFKHRMYLIIYLALKYLYRK